MKRIEKNTSTAKLTFWMLSSSPGPAFIGKITEPWKSFNDKMFAMTHFNKPQKENPELHISVAMHLLSQYQM